MSAAVDVVKNYATTSVGQFKRGHIFTALSPFRAFQACFLVVYVLIQRLIVHPFFKPVSPFTYCVTPSLSSRVF